MTARRFQIKGSALIDKVIISAQAKKALQGIVLKIDDTSLQKALGDVNAALRQLRGNVGALGTQAFGQAFGQAATNVNATSVAMKSLNTVTKKQRNLFAEVVQKASAFRVSTVFINEFINSIVNAVKFTVAFDKQLRNINKLLNLNDGDLRSLGTSLLKVAAAYNLTSQEVGDAFKVIAQLGLEGATATEKLANGMQLLKIASVIAQSSTLNVANAIELLIAVSKQFNQTIGEAAATVAKLSALEDASAVDAKDLFDIFKRAGTSISQTFKDLDQGLGVFSALQERTRVGGAVVGTFAKTLISRLSGANEDVVKTFRSLGIAIEDTTGKLKDPIQLLTELKSKVDALSEEDAGNVIGKVFGVRQAELGRATLDTLGGGANIGRAAELTTAAKTGFDTQLAKSIEDTKSISFEFNKLKNNVLGFLSSFSDSTLIPFLKGVASTLNDINGIMKDATGTFTTLLKTIGIVGAGALGNKVFGGLTNRLAGGIQGALGNATKKSNTPPLFAQGPNGGQQFALGNSVLSSLNPNAPSRRALGGSPGTTVLRGGPSNTPFFQKNNVISQAQAGVGNRVNFGTPGQILSGGTKNAIPNLLKDLKNFRSGITGGIDKLDKAFQPLSAQSILLTTALQTLGAEFGLFKGKLGGIFQTFADLAVFGPKIAILGATIKSLTTIASDAVERIKIRSGDLASASKFLKEQQGQEAQQAAGEIDKRLFIDNLLKQTGFVQGAANPNGAGQFDEETKQLLERVAQAFGAIAENTARNNTALVDDTKAFTQAAKEQIFRSLQTNEKTIPGLLEAIAGGTNLRSEKGKPLSESDIQKILSLPGGADKLKAFKAQTEGGSLKRAGVGQTEIFQSLAAAFSPALAQAFQEASAKSGGGPLNLIDIFTNAALERSKELAAGIKRDAEKERVTSREVVDIRLKELKSLQDIAIATIEAEQAENELYNARRNSADIDTIEQEIRVRESLRKVKLAALEEEVRIEKERDKKQYDLAQESTRLQIGEIENRLDSLNSLKEATQKTNDEIDLLTSRLISLKAPKEDFAFGIDTIAKEKELQAARLGSIKEQFNDEKQLFEIRNSANKKLRDDALDFANAVLGISDAQSEYIATFKNFNQVDKAKEEFKQASAASVIRLTALQQEVDVLKAGQEQIVAARKKAIQSEIDELDRLERMRTVNAELAGKPLKGPALNQFEEEKRTRKKEELKNVDTGGLQKIKDAEKAVQIQELKIQEERLKFLDRILKAERDLNKERMTGAVNLIKASRELSNSVDDIFDAQKKFTDEIRSKIDEAAANVKDKRGNLSDALSTLADARKALFSAVSDSAGVFAEYTLSVSKANIEADKLLGNFFGMAQEANALSNAYNAVIQSARAAGASEKLLADLRNESVKEQLGVFQRLLDEQRARGEKFFTSSSDDRRGFVQGISALQQVLSQFGGNIDNFRGLSETQLNSFGSSLISLPQELRQNIVNALELLPDGVGIGGLSKDQIKEVLQGASLGSSESLGIESLSDTILTVADLLRQSEITNVSALLETQTQTGEARAAVANAKEQVLFAKMQLEQAKMDAIKTQDAIRVLTDTVGGQIADYRAEFASEAERIAQSDATALEKQTQLVNLMADFNNKVGDILGNTASKISSINLGDTVSTNVGKSLPSSVIQDARPIFEQLGLKIKETNDELIKEIGGLNNTISVNFVAELANNTKALSAIGEEISKRSANKLEDLRAEIKIDNEVTYNIKGTAEIVQSVITALDNQGFVKKEQITDIQNTLNSVIQRLIQERVYRGSDILR